VEPLRGTDLRLDTPFCPSKAGLAKPLYISQIILTQGVQAPSALLRRLVSTETWVTDCTDYMGNTFFGLGGCGGFLIFNKVFIALFLAEVIIVA
jgi:hypothetical protein